METMIVKANGHHYIVTKEVLELLKKSEVEFTVVQPEEFQNAIL